MKVMLRLLRRSLLLALVLIIGGVVLANFGEDVLIAAFLLWVHPVMAGIAISNSKRSSIRAAIEDDLAIQSYINAYASGDSYRANLAWADHQRATSRASAAKNAFVGEYDRVRGRFGLGPLAVGGSY